MDTLAATSGDRLRRFRRRSGPHAPYSAREGRPQACDRPRKSAGEESDDDNQNDGLDEKCPVGIVGGVEAQVVDNDCPHDGAAQRS